MRLIVLLLPFAMSCTGMAQKLPEVDHIVRYEGTGGCAYEIMELDIEDVETIYIHIRTASLGMKLDELLSREPAERGKLVILAKKTCEIRPYRQGRREYIGDIDENQKNLWCGYLKSEDGKELFVATFFKDMYGGIIVTDGGFYTDLETQKPDNVKIKIYQWRREIPSHPLWVPIEEIVRSDKKEDIFTRIEGTPTKLRHLPGIKTEEEKKKEYEDAAASNEKPIVLSFEEIFEASVKEHNQKVEMIRASER